MSFEDLSEERQREICECEQRWCKYYPLKHFETCPICNSKSFHVTVFKKEEVI